MLTCAVTVVQLLVLVFLLLAFIVPTGILPVPATFYTPHKPADLCVTILFPNYHNTTHIPTTDALPTI